MLAQVEQIAEAGPWAALVVLLLLSMGSGLVMFWRNVQEQQAKADERNERVANKNMEAVERMTAEIPKIHATQAAHSDTCHATALKVDAIIDQVHAVHESLREWGEAHGDQEIVTYAERAERRLTEHLARTGR